MISVKHIIENIDQYISAINKKNIDLDLNDYRDKYNKRKVSMQDLDDLRSKKNKASKIISEKKQNNEDCKQLLSDMKELSIQIKEKEKLIKEIDSEIESTFYFIPNKIHSSVPDGHDESDNVVVRYWGEKPDFNFEVKSHVDLSTQNNLINFNAGSKIAGTGFPLYIGKGAKLERSLINYMLDYHIDNHSFVEVFPPFLSNYQSMRTTGQIPKFIDDMYKIPEDNFYLIPTAEVPLTNIHNNDILDKNEFPIKYAGYSACFRREAGSYGKDTRGLLRLHQFNKVELVKFCSPNDSYAELEKLVANAETILQKLGLHYRVIELCSGDLSFSAAKCYDLEVWSPFENKFLEVSSCSNFEDFQARRGNIRFRNSDNKLEYVHTLNGSGLATPRLMVSLIETYQKEDGSVDIPNFIF